MSDIVSSWILIVEIIVYIKEVYILFRDKNYEILDLYYIEIW